MKPGPGVLIVDDEPVIIAAARKILSRAGFPLAEATSAYAALRSIRRTPYRLVLCDLKLPGSGGWELLSSVRQHLPEAPVVMITGYATLESAITSFANGAFDFLPKPFDADELLAVVHRALRFTELGEARKRETGFEAFRRAMRAAGLESNALYALGRHSWASLDPDGSVRIGMGESFPGFESEVQTIELPELNEELLQGNRCTRIVTADDLVFRVWAPVSGRVVETNRELDLGPGHESDSIARRWIARVVSADLESELPNLARR